MSRLLPLVLALCSVGTYASDQAKCDSLSVAGAEQWRPFAFTTHTPTPSAHGIAHDVVKIIGKELDIPVHQQVEIPWKRIEFQLEQGQLDVLAGNYWTKERAEKWLLTDPIASEKVHIFTRRGEQFEFRALDNLRGKSGVVPRGISLGADFDEMRKSLQIVDVRTHEQMYDMLRAGRVDYLVSPVYAAQKHLNDPLNRDIVMLPQPINTYDVHLSLSPKSPCSTLLPKINKVIQDKKLDGTIDGIVRQYTE